jgi:hypothetical protein
MAASLYLNKVPPVPAWNSPALKVVKSAGIVNQDAGTPILDVDPVNTTESQDIQAVAGNDDLTQTAQNVRVQLWAYAVSTGPGVPSIYLASMNGTKGLTIPAGAATVSIGPLQEQPFARHWDLYDGLDSTAAEITTHFVNNEVHCCIFGNVYSPDDPTSAEIPDDPVNGPGPSLHVAANRHHAQRNMTIKLYGAPDELAFHMFATAADSEREHVVGLQIEELQLRRPEPWVLAELDALGPWIRRTDKSPRGGIPGVEVVFDDQLYPVRLGKRLDDLEMDVEEAGSGRELKVELGAGEARRMRLNATLPHEELALRVFEVTQTQDDETVGGVRVMAMTVPKELRRPRVRK